MINRRIVACLDVVNRNVTKAVQFQDNIEVGSAAEVMHSLYLDGIDEIVYYDIMATTEGRSVDTALLAEIADRVYIPVTVGGGISTVGDMNAALDAGAEKISIDSAAVRNPAIITQGANAFGSQCIVLSTQVKRVGVSDSIPSGYEVFVDGARTATGMDALEWVMRGEDLGAGEIVVNSIDRDGTQSGFDLDITAAVASNTNVPVIASGGAGELDHLRDVFTTTGATAAIVSSLLYSPRRSTNVSVAEMKSYLVAQGIEVRPHEPGLDPSRVVL